MRFASPVTHVYNPLDYARPPFRQYVARYAKRGTDALLLGMNPGPWGMAQTGIPFGAVAMVKDWLKIDKPVGKPKNEHPKRPVTGLACTRNEVSGTRLWSWARDRFGTPDRFARRFFVYNYCPLLFLEESGRNRTPDKLPAASRDKLFDACDHALRCVVERIKPRMVIGIGNFAQQRAAAALTDVDIKVGRILHPSPASPLANRNWAQAAEAQLAELGVDLNSQ